MPPPSDFAIDRRAACAVLLGAMASRAAALEPAGADPVLVVSGRLRTPNRGAEAVFDMPMLARLPQTDVVTRTPWYAGEARRFTGPLLRDVVGSAGAVGASVLRAMALNDYRVDIPASDVRSLDVIVARLLDGKPMAVREKGPLFVMYPFDQRPDLRNAVYFNRCIWQLRAIEVA